MDLTKRYQQKDQIYREIYEIQRKNKQETLERFVRNVMHPINIYNQRVHANRLAWHQQQLQQGRRRKPEFQIVDSRNVLLDNPEDNPEEEFLVPIRIDVDVDNSKFKDTFTWNLYENAITPLTFSQVLVSDMKLSQAFVKPIEEQISSQLQDFRFVLFKCERRFIPMINSTTTDSSSDLRIVIKISVTAACVTLDDSLETNLANLLSSRHPEYVASTLCVDLGLGIYLEFCVVNSGGDFLTAVSHLIREQAYLYLKTFFLTGDDLFLPEKSAIIRTSQQEREEFTPTLTTLTPDEQDRQEKLQERESRRKKRSTRGRKRNNAQSDMFGFSLVMEDDFGRGVQCLATPDLSEPFPTSRTYLPELSQLFTYQR